MPNSKINPLSRLLKALLWLVLLNSFSFLSFASELKTKTLQISQNINSELLGHHLDYWISTNSEMRIEDVLSLKEEVWTKEEYLTPNRGITSDIIWFRLKTENKNNILIPVLLSFGYPSIDNIRMFIFDSNQTSKIVELGDTLKFNSRPYLNRNFIVPINYLPSSEKIIYFRAVTSGSFQLPMHIRSEKEFNLSEEPLLITQSV